MLTKKELEIFEKIIDDNDFYPNKKSGNRILNRIVRQIKGSSDFKGNGLDNWTDYNEWNQYSVWNKN